MRGGLLVRGVGRRAAALSRVLWRAVRPRRFRAGEATAAAITASQYEFDNHYVNAPLWTGRPVR
jgi:hypothetical protein